MWSRLSGQDQERKERLIKAANDLSYTQDTAGWGLIKDYLNLRREAAVKQLLSGQTKDVDELRARANEIDCLMDWIQGCIKEGRRLKI